MSEKENSEILIRHLKAELFRDITPDGFLATQVTDPNGYYIKVLVLRNDVDVVSETLKGEWDGEKMVQFEEEVTIEQRPVRIQECAVKLTPRMAVNLHSALARELDALPEEVRTRYGIEKDS